MSISSQDFEYITGLLHKLSGLTLTQEKLYLLESRLTPLARRRGHPDISSLIAEVRTKPSDALLTELTEAMMTHESFFFRDAKCFDHLRNVVFPALRERRMASRKLRIWSAAASTGQEPYTLAMIFSEAPELWRDWSIELIGTDISSGALERAVAGIYTQFEVQRGLPVQLMMKYFVQHEEQWRVAPQLRSMVKWRKFNLLDSAAPLGVFDLILCRNVCIYFDPPVKQQVLIELNKRLAPDGLLVLGATETILGNNDIFKSVGDFPGFFGPMPAVPPLARTA